MELKPGYKQTEVGVIPEDWDVEYIENLTVSSSGATPSRALQDRYYANGSVPWVKTMDLTNSEITVTEECVTKLAIKETSLRIYPSGTVLVAMYGGFNQIGRTGLLRSPATVNQAITAIQPKAGSLVSEYLLSTLNYRVDYWKSVASSSRKDPNITGKDIRRFPIACPKPTEQEAIAEALGDADALIEALEQLIAKKRQIKQGAMQELLTGKKRLPGFESKPGYKQTEVGVIPEDWDAMPIGKFLEFKNGLNKAKQFFGSGTPIVNYMDVFRHPGLRKRDVAGRVTVTPEERRNYSAKAGDVFFTRTSETVEEIGTASVLLEDIEEAVFSGFVLRGRPISNALQLQFKKYCFCHEVVRNQITSTSSYTTRALTNGRLLSKVFIPVPPTKAEQTAIATILSDMDAEIAALEAKLDKTRQIKQGMMHNLLTGKIRLV